MKRLPVILIITAMSGIVLAGSLVIRFDTRKPLDPVSIVEMNIQLNQRGLGARSGNVALYVMAYRPEGDIIDIVEGRCTLRSLVDDNGRDLVQDADNWARGNTMSAFRTGITQDGKKAIVRFTVYALPSTGSKSLKAGGNIVLSLGTEKNVTTNRQVELVQDGEMKAGDTIMRITSVERDEEENTTRIIFIMDKAPSPITDIEFFDSKGNVIEKTFISNPRILIHGRQKEAAPAMSKITCTLAGLHESVGVKITYWSATREITVPFELTTSLGSFNR